MNKPRKRLFLCPLIFLPPKIFFHPGPHILISIMQETHFAIPPPPLQKLQTQQNRDTHRWTNRILAHIIIIFRIDFVSLYSHKKGIKGIPNPKQKGGEMWTEGGLPCDIPPRDPVGDQVFRTHPPRKKLLRIRLSIALQLVLLASIRQATFNPNRVAISQHHRHNINALLPSRIALSYGISAE